MPEFNRPLKVFLSYASQDKPLVRELSRRLVGEGWIDTWQDEKNLLPGQDWRVKIEEAVEEADVVIIVLSQHSVSKEGHVQKELRYAREIALEKPEDTIFLIPLRLDECEVPRGLRFYQWVDYFGERKNDGYDSLVESLKLRYEQKLKQEEESFARQEKIRKEHEAAEKIVREKVEKEAAEKARLEAKELAKQKAAKEKAEREAARKQAEKEAAEKVRLEEEEQARQKAAKEKVEREAAEKAVREKVEKEAAEKTRLEAEEQLKQKAAKEKAAREKVEKKAAEKAWSEAEEREKQKAAQDKKEREAAEKTARERAMRESAEKAKREKEKREASKEEKSTRKPDKLEAPKPESQSRQSDSRTQALFLVVGFVGVFLVIWLSTFNGSLEKTGNITATMTSQLNNTHTLTPRAATSSTNTPIPTRTPIPTSLESSITPFIVYDPYPESTDYIDDFDVPMRLVAAGTFTMGSNSGGKDELPVHQVYLDAFYIDKYEVTNALYRACVDDGVCTTPNATERYDDSNYAKHPVVEVFWSQAKAFCQWRDTSLPTEAQWEKAARGTDERTYPWGEGIDCSLANYGSCVLDTTEIGTYENGISPYGLYDMAGNVLEWTADWYSETYYEVSPASNPLGPKEGQYVVKRGGSVDTYNREFDYNTRSSYRGGLWEYQEDYGYQLGFRCAKDAP